MHPVSPVLPGSKPIETVYGEKQEEYIALPAVYLHTDEKVWRLWSGNSKLLPVVVFVERNSRPVLSRWRLTEEERMAIAAGADVVLTLLTFNAPLAPSHLQVTMPDEMPVFLEE